MKKLFLTVLLAGAVSMSAAAAETAAVQEYLMTPGDQVILTVYGHPDLSSPVNSNTTPYVVRPDGGMSVPLIGDVMCQGRSVREVTDEIQRRLAEYIIRPQVSVNITKLGTTRVYVLGEIKKQGLYELEKSHTLIDALAKAEGFTEKSAKKNVFVIRRGQDEPLLKININDFLRKGKAANNIVLHEGDTVFLSSNAKVTFQRDIMPFFTAFYYGSEIKENNKN